jgi:hypothetical protein
MEKISKEFVKFGKINFRYLDEIKKCGLSVMELLYCTFSSFNSALKEN